MQKAVGGGFSSQDWSKKNSRQKNCFLAPLVALVYLDFESIFCHLTKIFFFNKPVSPEATLVWNYDPASHSQG